MFIAKYQGNIVYLTSNKEEIESSNMAYDSIDEVNFAEQYNGVIYTDVESLDEAKKTYIRKIRNELLKNSDGWGIQDRPQTDEVLLHKKWREYLRNYTNNQNWWLSIPMDYNEFLNNKNVEGK